MNNKTFFNNQYKFILNKGLKVAKNRFKPY